MASPYKTANMAAGLSVWDYVVFGVMLASSSIIGIYYGCKAKKRSTKEYLIAGGSMHWFPISMSLLASYFSAVGLMGIPAEVYTYGVSFIFRLIGFATSMIIAAHVYAPIFCKSRITSANEVFDLEFIFAANFKRRSFDYTNSFN